MNYRRRKEGKHKITVIIIRNTIVCSINSTRENESYLKKLCDTIREVLVALDVELQFVESGWQCR